MTSVPSIAVHRGPLIRDEEKCMQHFTNNLAANAELELNALAEFLGTKVGSALTANDLKALGVERLRELKSKYFPPNRVDEFKNYSLNSFIDGQERPATDNESMTPKKVDVRGHGFAGHPLTPSLDGAE